MASSTTDSTDVQQNTAERQGHSNKISPSRVIPECNHVGSNALQRLATFSALIDRRVISRISPVRLAGSGCVYNSEEGYVECIYGGKITLVEDGPVMTTLNDLRHYHNPLCDALTAYISIQERDVKLGIVNLHILNRLRNQRIMLGGTSGQESLIQVYGITPRIREFDEVTDYR